MKEKREKRLRRKRRVGGKVSGTKSVPRLSVFRSNVHIYAQIIDDRSGKTLVSFSDLKIPKGIKSMNKTEAARYIGEELAKKAKPKKIKKIVFDRGGYKYHGRVKALAEGARKGGLVF